MLVGDLSSDLFKIYLIIYLVILICICNNESSKQIKRKPKMNFTKSQLNLNTDIGKLTSILQAKNAYCGGYLYK